MGGNGTALGIKGASVATFGANSATEKDTTVFGGNANQPKTDGLGETTASGNLKVADLAATMAASGNTLPQVSNDGTGTITGTWRVVTSDGTANNKNGDLFAVIDSTGTGKYSKGTQTTATTDLVGNGQGNVVQRAVTRALRAVGIQRRANNVGADAVSEILNNQPSLFKILIRYFSPSLSRSPPVLPAPEVTPPAVLPTSASSRLPTTTATAPSVAALPSRSLVPPPPTPPLPPSASRSSSHKHNIAGLVCLRTRSHSLIE